MWMLAANTELVLCEFAERNFCRHAMITLRPCVSEVVPQTHNARFEPLLQSSVTSESGQIATLHGFIQVIALNQREKDRLFDDTAGIMLNAASTRCHSQRVCEWTVHH
jgi:hypothetical protein